MFFSPPQNQGGKRKKCAKYKNARNTLKLIGYCLLFFHDIYGKDAIAIEFCVVSREDHLDLYFTALYVQVKPQYNQDGIRRQEELHEGH